MRARALSGIAALIGCLVLVLAPMALLPAPLGPTAAALPARLSALRPAPPPSEGARPRIHVDTAIAITARQSTTPIVMPDVKETVRRIDMAPE